MIIILGGHLDRSLRLGSQPDRFRIRRDASTTTHDVDDHPYRSFFHRAGMITLLSDARLDHSSLSLDMPAPRPRRRPDGALYEAVTLRELEDDGKRLAHFLVCVGAFSDETLAMMHLCAHNDPQEPHAAHHAEDLLISSLHAWMTGSTLVLSASDGQALAEIVACVLEHGLPLPFGIPDLRGVSCSDPRATGPIANLQPGDVGDLIKIRETPAVRLYRSRLGQLAESRKTDYASALEAALREAGMRDLRLRDAPANIRLTSVRARVIDNSDLDAITTDPLGWSRRRAVKGKLHVILLSDARSLL